MKQHFSPQYAGKYSNVLKIKKKKKKEQIALKVNQRLQSKKRGTRPFLPSTLTFKSTIRQLKKKYNICTKKIK